MSARDEILRALRAASSDAPLPDLLAHDVMGGDVPAGAAKRSPAATVDRFVERAVAAGVEVIRVEGGQPASAIARLAVSAGVKAAVVWDDEVLDGVRAALQQEGIAVTDRPDQADAGITTADYAIAETGTLVLATSVGRPRATSLVPPRHLVVLPAHRISGTLFDLLPQLRALPSALTFITGPSRTADIELTPIRGVHGPVAVTVFITK